VQIGLAYVHISHPKSPTNHVGQKRIDPKCPADRKRLNGNWLFADGSKALPTPFEGFDERERPACLREQCSAVAAAAAAAAARACRRFNTSSGTAGIKTFHCWNDGSLLAGLLNERATTHDIASMAF